MSSSSSGDNRQLLSEAQAYGQHLAKMLAASHFTPEEQAAWAALVPQMNPEQLKKFDDLLRADMSAQASHELQDLLVALKAAQHKRDLSMSAVAMQTDQALDEIEKVIAAAE